MTSTYSSGRKVQYEGDTYHYKNYIVCHLILRLTQNSVQKYNHPINPISANFCIVAYGKYNIAYTCKHFHPPLIFVFLIPLQLTIFYQYLFLEQIHLAGAHAATTQKKGQKQAPKAPAKLSVSPGSAGSKKSKSKNITISQPSQQESPTTKSLLSTLSEPITGSLLLDTSDIKLGETSAVLKLESDQPVRSEQSLDLMLSDSSKLSSTMIPLHNSTLPPDMIFSSDENSSGNEFASDSS